MNDERIISLLAAQTAALGRIAVALETIAMTNAPAPNFVKPIAAYANFDFSTIGAGVTQYDANGPTELEWGGYAWTRRSPQNKFGEAIWFSRSIGKDADGNIKFSRLITFKKMSEAEPLPRKVEALVEKSSTPAKPAASALPKSSVPAEAASAKSSEPTLSPEGEAELEKYFGPNPRMVETWPTTESEFGSWLKSRGWNGKETHTVLGTDSKSWLKMNAGKSWSDIAKTVSSVLGAK